MAMCDDKLYCFGGIPGGQQVPDGFLDQPIFGKPFPGKPMQAFDAALAQFLKD